MYLAAIADAQPPPPTTAPAPAPAPAMASQVFCLKSIRTFIFWISLLLCVWFLLDDGTASFDATA